MKTQTREKIVDFVAKSERATPKSIIEHVGLTPPAVFKQLGKLLRDGVLKKQGRPPKVFYFVVRSSLINRAYSLAPETERIINERFMKMSPEGILQHGKQAFIQWCLARGTDPVRTAVDYVATIHKFDAYKKNGLIDGIQKLKRTFPHIYLDKLYYLDFYSIERFGKTKLGELILYSKQSQNSSLIKAVVSDARPRIAQMLKEMKIDAVGFIPPTVKRDVQFMRELEKLLHLPTRLIKITKVKTPIIVPQKTLNKLEERVENARQSLVVEDEGRYKNILLIDDAVGSGATINEVGRQIRQKGLCTGKVIGLGLAGSFNGFEIIQEV